MESQYTEFEAFEMLRHQLDEGVDEWLLDEPVSRFEEVNSEKAKPVAAEPEPKSVPRPVPAQEAKSPKVCFENCGSEEAVIAALEAALPEQLTQSARNKIVAYQEAAAEIAIIIDPPTAAADRAADLMAEPAMKLLEKSLGAIDIAFDAASGKEPRARMQFLPISPWRMPQDRKIIDSEADIFCASLERRIVLGNYRAVLFAGSNLAGVEEKIEEGKFAGIPAFGLVSPSLMLRTPLLKKRHWQMLVEFRGQLEGIMKT